MLTKIQKWGNSQGMRFSRNILRQARIAVGDNVDVVVENGEIVIKPVQHLRGKYQLKNLCAKIPRNYKPVEEHWGNAVGKEIW
jgi:antitoxin MazE